jgi:hypothetical protein
VRAGEQQSKGNFPRALELIRFLKFSSTGSQGNSFGQDANELGSKSSNLVEKSKED